MMIAFWRKPVLAEERRHALEQWARLRLELVQEDPMAAIIGAVGRLTAEGMKHEVAVDVVLGIVREGAPPAP